MDINLTAIVMKLVIFYFSLTIHEFAHSYMAEKCGDSTSRYLGRMTLNPLAHIDPIGTVLLPLLAIFNNAHIMFGWAKPVPINPLNFRNPRWDSAKVGLAGPVANILVAIIAATLFRLFLHFNISPGLLVLGEFLAGLVLMNLILAIFNLIPIPPLDGSHLLANLLPPNLAYRYERLQMFGMTIVIILLFTGVLGAVIFPMVQRLNDILLFF